MYIPIDIKIVRNRKKEKPSRGYSKRIWKPRKKNLMAFGKRNAKRPNPTPIRVKKPYFFSLYIISINYYSTNIRNLFHINKHFLNYFYIFFQHFNSHLCSPTHNHPKDTKNNPYIQAKNMTICQNPQKSYQHTPKVINMTFCHPAYRTKSSSPKSEVIHQT